MSTLSVAVIGLGIMGAGMARNLAAKGFSLTVHNRNPDKAAPFQGSARIAATPADAVKDADIVIAMVSDDAASRGIWLEGGALKAMKPGAILIESSTLSVDWTRELAGLASAAGIGFIDAPVTGSKQQANDGALRFFAGGAAADIEKAKPAFLAMGTEVIHLGPAGSGAVLKLINNFMAGVQVVTLAEGLALAGKLGLDVDQARNVLINGAPGSPLVKGVAARIAANDFSPNFFTVLMAKDLDYVGRAAASVGLTLDTAAAARARFLEAASAGYAEKDIAAVIEPLRK
jgi:3-hydroxyisobutyrate dehydrogenase